MTMASKASANAMDEQARSMPFLGMGEAMIALQRETLGAYEQWNREWLAYMQSEAALWADLARELTTARSIPEAVDAYARCMSQQMHMTAEQGHHLFNGYQKLGQRVTKSVAMPAASRRPGRSSGERRE